LPGPPNQSPKPMVPNYQWCAAVRRNSVTNLVKSPVSALWTQWRFFALSPPNVTNLQGGSYLTKLSVCFPYSPLFDGKVISNSDDQIFTVRRVCIAWTMPWQDVCLSVRPSVRHTPVLSVNGYTYTQNFFIVG